MNFKKMCIMGERIHQKPCWKIKNGLVGQNFEIFLRDKKIQQNEMKDWLRKKQNLKHKK